MTPSQQIRTSTALNATARSLAVSAPVAQSGSTTQSARISGSGIGLVDASLETVVAHEATRPDSLIPSRMAALSTIYASQQVISSEITPMANENKKARPTASLNAASMNFSLIFGTQS